MCNLAENQVPVHVTGEGAEVQENLVGRQTLLHDVLPVHGHDGDTDEQVEVVCLVVGPARLPDTQGSLLRELTLEAQQDPPGDRDRHTEILFS